MTRRAVLLAAAVGLCSWGAYATPTLTLIPPSGNLTGYDGQTVGWGFTITNDTSDWLLITGSFFCNAGGDPNFTDCTTPGTGPTFFGPQFGTYTDYIGTRATEVPPTGQTGPTAFSRGSPGFGVGEYKVNSNAPLASMDLGNIFVTYAEYQGSPVDGGTPDPNDPGNLELSAAASVTVVPVPEPATFLLVGGSLVALAGLRLRRHGAR
jgi:hypothetical protein